jgi:YHS domain-containing protein
VQILNEIYYEEEVSAMKSIKILVLAATVLFVASLSMQALAMDYTQSTPGLSGYDPVAYFTEGKPVRGSGYNVAVYKGVTYAFASKKHKKMFEANPEKYVPAYGGYCAYGVAVGKKFVTDPEVWKIVDGKLYLNLDRDIQRKWNKDVPGYIKKADDNWLKIKDKAPSDL